MPKKLTPGQMLLLLLVVFVLPGWLCVADANGELKFFWDNDKALNLICAGFAITEPAGSAVVPAGTVHIAWSLPANTTGGFTTFQTLTNEVAVSTSVNAIDLNLSAGKTIHVELSVPVNFISRGLFGPRSSTSTCYLDSTINVEAAKPPPPPPMACGDFHFTSPRAGLLNAVNTFYWDPIPQAASYRINIYSNGSTVATFDAPGSATNLQGDTSSSTIGGDNPFIVEAIALDAYGQSCKDAVTMDREWPTTNTGSPQPTAQPTLTCAENPDAPYCR